MNTLALYLLLAGLVALTLAAAGLVVAWSFSVFVSLEKRHDR